jgi:uncharacterized protein
MKVSRYTITLSNFPDPGKHLVFNTRTQAQVVIDNELKGILESLPAAPDEKTAQALTTLERLGITAGDSIDEDAVITDWFDKMRANRSTLKPTVLTTYSCNFACSYCVENGVRNPVFMKEETARKTASYILAEAKKLGTKNIFITFYGGEPLLNLSALRTVARETGRPAREAGISFAFGMSTNGSLLTRDVVQELKDLGLARAKITLDGTREAHDRKRPFAGGKGSFDTIVKNVQDSLDLITIDIGGNFDNENAADIPRLLDYLAELGLQKKVGRILFKPICPTFQDREGMSPSVEMECVYGSMENVKRMVELSRMAAEKGFSVDDDIGVHFCEAVSSRTSFTIDPEGRLYRCPAFVGRESFSSGDIGSGEREAAFPELWKRCAGCAYVPLCGDGCIFDAFIRFGDAGKLSCHREAMEYTVREALKDSYTRSHKR